MGIDVKKLDSLYKALDTSTSNGNNVLDPVLLSQIITEEVRVKPTLLRELPRMPFSGKALTYDVCTSQGDAVTQTDGGTLSGTDAKFAQNSVNMSYYYYAMQITNPAIVAAEQLVDVVNAIFSTSCKCSCSFARSPNLHRRFKQCFVRWLNQFTCRHSFASCKRKPNVKRFAFFNGHQS